MDKAYLFGRNTSLGELPTNIVIDVKAAVIFRDGEVAENKLRRLCVGVFLPDTVDFRVFISCLTVNCSPLDF